MLKAWIEAFRREQIWLEGESHIEITSIESNSKRLEKASHAKHSVAFFARKGAAKDGHEFLSSLSNNPAIGVFIVEKLPSGFSPSVPVIVVRDSTLAMALAAKSFYKNPTSDAFTFAVTGTNGKTTTTFLVQSLLKVLGKRPARMGTIEVQFENFRELSELTTPDFTEIQKTFSELKAKGADAFVFEASSHALDQRRLLGLDFDAALFTNLTPEHLDYHRTMEKYFEAKQKLFLELLLKSPKKERYAVIPRDGAYGNRLIEAICHLSDIESWTWGRSGVASERTLVIDQFETTLSGTQLTMSGGGLKSQIFKSHLVGAYNVENIAGMLALGLALGAKPEQLQRALNDLPHVPGRLEAVPVKAGIGVFVDYAHTPDALENVLMTLRPLTKGRLRVVFGCGGDRDKTKRPKMGAIAELYADELFVTSDNPRTEDPESILDEIVGGLQRLKPVVVEVDRRKAISLSLKNLKSGDVVLIAGKGHENYQILGTEKIHFDDREVVEECYLP